MKTAYISYFIDDMETEKKRLELVRKSSGNDEVSAVIGGNYLQNGLPIADSPADIIKHDSCRPSEFRHDSAMETGENKNGSGIGSLESRIRLAQSIGIRDAYIMPLYSSLASIGIFGSSIANMISEDKEIESVVFETDNADIDLLQEISMLRIKNSVPFQKKVTAYKMEGLPFYDALAICIGEQIDGAEKIMRSPENILATECIMAMKFRYSHVKCHAVQRIKPLFREVDVSENWNEAVKKMLYSSENVLSDTCGGFEKLSEEIAASRDQFHDLKQYARLLAVNGRDEITIRKYLLRLVLHIRKLDIIMWQTHDFILGTQHIN